MDSETIALKQEYEQRCAKASLTPEQTARVIDFGLDQWRAGSKEVNAVISFFERENQEAFDREYQALTAPSGILTESVR